MRTIIRLWQHCLGHSSAGWNRSVQIHTPRSVFHMLTGLPVHIAHRLPPRSYVCIPMHRYCHLQYTDHSVSTVHQLKIVRPTLLVAHRDNLTAARTATATVGIPESQIILLQGSDGDQGESHPVVESLIQEHEGFAPYAEWMFRSGEAKTTTAFLCFSSGTTGFPKVRLLH